MLLYSNSNKILSLQNTQYNETCPICLHQYQHTCAVDMSLYDAWEQALAFLRMPKVICHR